MTALPLWVAAEAVGACIGSFCATAAGRAARAESVVLGRSHCDACQTPLGFAQTIPLVSYLWQRGACIRCRSPIDVLHPLGELAGAVIGAAALVQSNAAQGLLTTILGATLLTTAMIDARTRKLPDGLTLLAAAAAAGAAWLRGPELLGLGLVAAVLSFVILALLRQLFLWRRRIDGLGLGDVKLVAALALGLGAQTPWMLALASAGGLVGYALVRPKDGRLPFGPFIATAGFGLGALQGFLPWRG